MEYWGHSSVGRAPALQAGGHRFDPVCLHQRLNKMKLQIKASLCRMTSLLVLICNLLTKSEIDCIAL